MIQYREILRWHSQGISQRSIASSVGVISTWIIAALRHGQFFSLRELNEAVSGKLDEFNRKPFQKRPGSRLSVFLDEEKPSLLPLPKRMFELASWKIATVAFNYHVAVDKMQYSVPYEYIKHKVDVRLTQRAVETFYQGNRIASHARRFGKPGQYATAPPSICRRITASTPSGMPSGSLPGRRESAKTPPPQ